MQPARPWILPTEPTCRADLIRLGVSPRMIRTGLATGALVAVRHGVVVGAEFWPADPIEQHLVRARAEVAANPGAVLSHQSAALVWALPAPGFTPWEQSPVSITRPHAARSAHARGAVHHAMAVPSGQIHHDRRGFDVTTPARTAIDLAAGLDLPGALAILDGASRVICASMVPSIRRRGYENQRLVQAARDVLAEAATTARLRPSRAVLELVCPARESAPESVSAGHIVLAGLPMPRFQVELRTPQGSFWADLLWEEHRLIGECDGAMKYTDPQAVVAEKRREQALRDLGFDIVRWEATESVLRPDVMLGRISRALGL